MWFSALFIASNWIPDRNPELFISPWLILFNIHVYTSWILHKYFWFNSHKTSLRDHSITGREEKHKGLEVRSFHRLCGLDLACLEIDLFRTIYHFMSQSTGPIHTQCGLELQAFLKTKQTAKEMENMLAGHLGKTHWSQLSDLTWEVLESRRESSRLVSDSH